jgi:hypothetical protein
MTIQDRQAGALHSPNPACLIHIVAIMAAYLCNVLFYWEEALPTPRKAGRCTIEYTKNHTKRALLQSLPYLQLLCCQVCAEHVIIAPSTVQRQEATRR